MDILPQFFHCIPSVRDLAAFTLLSYSVCDNYVSYICGLNFVLLVCVHMRVCACMRFYLRKQGIVFYGSSINKSRVASSGGDDPLLPI